MRIVPIAINTFKEAIRDKILYNILFFALLMIGASMLLATLTVGEQSKIIIDIGLASINIFGVLMSIFLGIGLINKEIEKRTVYNIVSKPISRFQFLAGKYLGLIITISVNIFVMGMGLYFIMIINKWRWGQSILTINHDIWKAMYLLLLELMLVTSIALFFSTFSSSSTISAVLTMGAYVTGHLTEDLRMLGGRFKDSFLKGFTEFLYYILPNLDNFNVKGKVVYGLEVSFSYITMVTAYGLLYIIILFVISALIFQKREFK